MEPRHQSSFSRRLRRHRSRAGGEVLSLPGEALDIGESVAPLALPAPPEADSPSPRDEGETFLALENRENAGPAEDAQFFSAPAPAVPPPHDAATAAVEDVPVQRRRRPGADRPPGAWMGSFLKPSLLLLALLGAGAAGYGLRASRAPAGRSMPNAPPSPAAPAARANAEPSGPPEAEVEAAYVLLKERRFADARTRFLALAASASPGSETQSSLQRAVAWSEVSGGDASGAERSLRAQIQNDGGMADTHFLIGISHLLQGRYPESKAAFARSLALDPTRGDVYFLWGDTLRREGRPRESIEKFQAALRRNRLETNEGFYQLKLWFSQLQAGAPEAAEASAAIDSVLQRGPNVPGMVQAAAAARALNQNRPADAIEALRRARLTVEPLLFTLILQDPTFAQESWRPDWAEFFRK